MKTETANETPERFEEALTRLEAIVTEMERGQIDLETMIRRFEEGQRLVALCEKKLNEVERKIERLVKTDSDVTVEPLTLDGQGSGHATA